jgi:hypothetical protein
MASVIGISGMRSIRTRATNGTGYRPGTRAGSRSLVAAAVVLAVPAWAQEAPPTEEQRPEPSGIRLNRVSAYAAGYRLQWPGVAGGSGDSTNWLAGGAGADVGWWHPGRQTGASVRYQVGYTHTQRFESLRGFDHSIAMALRRNVSRRTALSLDATGDSRIASNALLGMTRSLTAVQRPSTAGELVGWVLDGAEGLESSPLEAAISGTRRTSAAVHAGLTHSHSRRLSSHAGIGVGRVLRVRDEDPEIAASFPSFTIGSAEAGLTYSLSRSTQVSGTGTYARSYSRAHRLHWQSATLGLGRSIGRRSYAYLAGGYERLSELGPSRFRRNSYGASAAIGTATGQHTLVAMVRRGLGDMRGLGGDSTISAEGAWTWARPLTPWSVGGSVQYERVGNRGLGLLEMWSCQATLQRRLTSELHVAFGAVYITSTGPNWIDLSGRGVRLSLVWTPGSERPQAAALP